MSVRARCLSALRRLRRSEEGIALPLVVIITAIGLTFASVTIVASVHTQTGDSRDQASNAALAAADAGANLAVLRQSQMMPASTAPCVTESGGKLVTGAAQTSGSASGWCTAVGPITLSQGTVTYQVKPEYATEANAIKVVATGSSSAGATTVTRRIALKASSTAGSSTATNVWAGGQVVGIKSLTMSNGAQVYNGGAASNGSVSLTGGANVCGAVHYGTTYTANNGSENPPSGCSAGRPFVKETGEYPSVSLPTSNADSSLASSGNTITWNKSNKTLVIGNGGKLTLSTGPYLLCKLEVTEGATLAAASGAKLSFFFEAPQNCAGLNGAPQLAIWDGATVLPDSGNGPGFYLVGSTTAGASKVELQGGSESEQIVIYAPHSTINAANGIITNGAIIGETLNLAGGSSINKKGTFTPPSSSGFVESTATAPTPFARSAYIECSAAGSGAPDTGC